MTVEANPKPWTNHDVRGAGRVAVNGKRHHYTVLHANFILTSPYFSGYIGDQLYISEEIAWDRDHPTWGKALLTYEILIATINDVPSVSWRRAFDTELTLVPPEELFNYLAMRLTLLSDRLGNPRPGSGSQERAANRALREYIVDLIVKLSRRAAITRYLEALSRFD